MLLVSSCFDGPDDKDIKARIDNSAYWFIENGLALYYGGKSTSELTAIIKSSQGVSLYMELVVNDSGELFHGYPSYLAGFVPNYFSRRAGVFCYSRVKKNGRIYEYWGHDSFSIRREHRNTFNFIVTEAESLDSKRVIVKDSSDFFSEYVTEDGVVINFPLDNYYLVKELLSSYSRYSNQYGYNPFKGTELDGVTIEYIDGKYVKKKAGE